MFKKNNLTTKANPRNGNKQTEGTRTSRSAWGSETRGQGWLKPPRGGAGSGLGALLADVPALLFPREWRGRDWRCFGEAGRGAVLCPGSALPARRSAPPLSRGSPSSFPRGSSPPFPPWGPGTAGLLVAEDKSQMSSAVCSPPPPREGPTGAAGRAGGLRTGKDRQPSCLLSSGPAGSRSVKGAYKFYSATLVAQSATFLSV